MMPDKMEGQFSGTLDEAGLNVFDDLSEDQTTMVYLYGPADLSRPKRWLYILAGRFFGTPYPEKVIASGPAHVSFAVTETNKEGQVVSGEFRRSGEWTIEKK